jgi:hypothetical protein
MRNKNSPFHQVLNEAFSLENANSVEVKECKICSKPITHGVICPVCRFYISNTGSPAYVAKHPEYFEKKKCNYLDVLQETRRQESIEDDFGDVGNYEEPLSHCPECEEPAKFISPGNWEYEYWGSDADAELLAHQEFLAKIAARDLARKRESMEPTLGDMRKNNVETALSPVDDSEPIPSAEPSYSERSQFEEPGEWNSKEKAVIEKFKSYEPQLGSVEAILKASQELGFPYAGAHEIISSYQSLHNNDDQGKEIPHTAQMTPQGIFESIEDEFGDVKGFKKPAQAKILRTRLEKELGKEEQKAIEAIVNGGSILTFTNIGETWISTLHVYAFTAFPKYSNTGEQARKFFNFLIDHNMIKQSGEPIVNENLHHIITPYEVSAGQPREKQAVSENTELRESAENDIGGVEDFEEPVGLVGQHIVVHVPEDSSDAPNSIAADYNGAEGIIKSIRGNRVVADMWDEHYKDYVEIIVPRRWLSLEESTNDFGDVDDFETPDAFVQGNVDEWVDMLLNKGLSKKDTLDLLRFYRELPADSGSRIARHPNYKYLKDFAGEVYRKIRDIPDDAFEGTGNIYENKGETALKNLREGDLNRMKFGFMLDEFLEFSGGQDPEDVDDRVIEGFLNSKYPGEFTVEEFMELYDDFIDAEMAKMEMEDEEYNDWLGSGESDSLDDDDIDGDLDDDDDDLDGDLNDELSDDYDDIDLTGNDDDFEDEDDVYDDLL